MSDGSSDVAPSETQTRTMSRIERIPTMVPPSTTTRWRKPPLTMAAVVGSVQEGSRVTPRLLEDLEVDVSTGDEVPLSADEADQLREMLRDGTI